MVAVLIGFDSGSSQKNYSDSSVVNEVASIEAKTSPEGFRYWINQVTGRSSQPQVGQNTGYTPRIGSSKPFDRPAYEPVLPPSEGRPEVEGEPLEVFVQIPSKRQQLLLRPNQGREYPRVYVSEGETVSVRVEFSQSPPGTKVAVVPQDGGALAGRVSIVHSIDSQRAIAFDFTASRNRGTHRVKLTTQLGETHLLDFWVGKENPFRTASAP